MALRRSVVRRHGQRLALLACGLALLLALPATRTTGQQGKLDMLRIGTSGSLTADEPGAKEKSALKTLKGFIKDKTGLDNEIVRLKDWRELTEKMSKGQLRIGVFQGYEFAWAQKEHPKLKPLTVAVNVYRYPVAYVVVKRNDPAKDFGGLQGRSLALPATGQGYLHLFVERQSQAKGKDLKTFFSKVTPYENLEDALDAVVDGTDQAAVADRAALEAYKRRKPGRFRQLREVAHSQPFPPGVIAYYDSFLDQATLRRFRDGLLNANKTEKGETMLTYFRLTGFEKVPADFQKVLDATRAAEPPPHVQAKK